jgi:hypothetical protein
MQMTSLHRQKQATVTNNTFQTSQPAKMPMCILHAAGSPINCDWVKI